ncbi:propionate--CoA ligase [Ramlibacter sp. H39-3-26]|uniref:propionate--CoA ligase n=1 Tax=Curvibacter soli TaxID=3031331 RepID=UPI0023DB311E|nr:propionate--CoA ligase [Ramlibacter sp. H39-3-26]MDF1485724.1 propionate--CoA ligase [Ramlibacter sp. H39-3-26]
MADYAQFYRRSLDERDAFWAEQAELIDWKQPPQQICDYSHPPFARWFVGGTTNLCHNAVDRHLSQRALQPALICVSTETGQERSYTFSELHVEVQRMAAVLRALGVRRGDRVLLYMPMIAEAAFAMLACARIGALHTVVFGGFAASSLASRIDDAEPTVIVSADAGSRGGKVVPYKPLLDEALRIAHHKTAQVLMVERGLAPMSLVPGRDHAWTTLREQHLNAEVACEWVDATHPSYTLYTSGTTGRPKGVQRDTGGYAVALAASMRHIFDAEAGQTLFTAGPPQGEKAAPCPSGAQDAPAPGGGDPRERRSVGVFFCTSDIGWVVGHSYIIYAPLIAGMATILYEGLPTRPDAGVWWSLVEKYRVTHMFSAPTAVRVLKKQDPRYLRRYDLSSLTALFLAGEPLDEPTAHWISDALGVPIVDNYWQTETGWPILTIARGVEKLPTRLGSPGFPMYGYDVRLVDEATGEDLKEPNQKGVLAIEGPLPPGCMQTVWRDDARFVGTYWGSIPGRQIYSTFDWGIRDKDGYYFILGRTDDVINVAGHRLGTREIEECIAQHAGVAEVAVVGVADALKGQVAMAFAVARDATGLDAAARLRLEGEIMKLVDGQLGAVARPARVHIVALLPKTRSGKLLRRALQAVCEGRDPGDLTTMEDPAALEQARALAQG